MIQSKHPELLSAPTENSKVPEPATFTIIQVGFNSPASKQPELLDAGFKVGLLTLPTISSSSTPKPFGSTAKFASWQMFTAVPQSDAVTWQIALNCTKTKQTKTDNRFIWIKLGNIILMLKTSVSQKGEEDYVSSHPSIVMGPLLEVA